MADCNSELPESIRERIRLSLTPEALEVTKLLCAMRALRSRVMKFRRRHLTCFDSTAAPCSLCAQINSDLSGLDFWDSVCAVHTSLAMGISMAEDGMPYFCRPRHQRRRKGGS